LIYQSFINVKNNFTIRVKTKAGLFNKSPAKSTKSFI